MLDTVIKRNGNVVSFDDTKILNAISKANHQVDEEMTSTDLLFLVEKIVEELNTTNTNSIEGIQDVVENMLIKYNYPNTAKEYILYRDKRSKIRNNEENLMNMFKALTYKESSEVDNKRENANIDTNSSMGTMLKYGSESSKYFIDHYVLPKHISEAHLNGDIHIHDKDFYMLTETCCQIDIIKLFKDGFFTGHGFLREPNSIESYAALCCIAIQANQNEMHGGQSVPNFDYAMVDGVRKTFQKELKEAYIDYTMIYSQTIRTLDPLTREKCAEMYEQTSMKDFDLAKSYITLTLIDHPSFHNGKIDKQMVKCILTKAIEKTERRTYQAMEALIHNLCTMSSRAGAQVPFSSLNYGTAVSPEARMVTKNLLLATKAGLGFGEVAIFPVQIFKVKAGINYSPGDPNYDLFQLAMEVSAEKLFPNFSFLDAPFNLEPYRYGNYETEVAYMGCRTRVMSNVNDPDKATTCGRGNLSFTTINLPRLGIEANKDIDKFFSMLDEKIDLVFEQLLHRFKIQSDRHVYNYPFLMGNSIWMDSEKLDIDDKIGEVLKHGTLTLGFIGLAETLKALTGYHHGESEESQKLGLRIISHMRDRCDKKSEEMKLNFSLIATPSEGLCLDGDTPILKANGEYIKIKDIKVGDVLPTYNEETKEIELDEVVKSGMTFEKAKVMRISLNNNSRSVVCTWNHPFGVYDKKTDKVYWTRAEDLREGDKLYTITISRDEDDISFNEIVSKQNYVSKTEFLKGLYPVYDITMKNNHNFFIGSGRGGILVHNSGRFTKIDREKYGEIEGITDRIYYTNSFH